MKQIINALIYMILSVIVIFITIFIINNITPVNHTHNKELEKKLIGHKWITQKYYNDELKDIILMFNSDHTITFKYIDTNKSVYSYYQKCNKWEWTKDNKIINIKCDNNKYNDSTIEIISITNTSLKVKTNSEYLALNKE